MNEQQQQPFENQDQTHSQETSPSSIEEQHDDEQPDLAKDVPHAPLATGQHMPVQPGNLAAAKDALAAQRAAERAVAEQGEDAQINPENFRSIASPIPPSAEDDSQGEPADQQDDYVDELGNS